jgi:hypothetical protein
MKNRVFKAGCLLVLVCLCMISLVQTGSGYDNPSEPVGSSVLADPIAGGELLLGYTTDGEPIAGQYDAFVVCREIDGSLSLWVAMPGAGREPSVLALEADWGVDLQPVGQTDPDFSDDIDA